MSPKLSLFIIFVVAVTHLEQPVSADLAQPYSFVLYQQSGFTQSQINPILSDAEQAKRIHGSNLNGISKEMRVTLDARYGRTWNCFTNLVYISGSFYFDMYRIIIRDTADNMHITCFRSALASDGDNVKMSNFVM